MDRKPFENILPKDFECKNDPPRPDEGCPALSMFMGGIVNDSETGEWTCPYCYSVVQIDQDTEDELFDDDEEEGEAFEQENDFVAEGDKLIQQTDEERARIRRERWLELTVFKLGGINPKFAAFIDSNRYYLIDELRVRETSGEPAFSGTLILPKLIAIAVFRYGKPVPDTHLKTIGTTRNAIRPMITTLLETTDAEPMNQFEEKVFYVGGAAGVKRSILAVMVEQYDSAGRPPNKVRDETTRAAAWIYIQGKTSNIKGLTKTKLKKIPGVKKNALDRAIDSFEQFLANRNKPVEVVESIDD